MKKPPPRRSRPTDPAAANRHRAVSSFRTFAHENRSYMKLVRDMREKTEATENPAAIIGMSVDETKECLAMMAKLESAITEATDIASRLAEMMDR